MQFIVRIYNILADIDINAYHSNINRVYQYSIMAFKPSSWDILSPQSMSVSYFRNIA